MHQQLAGMAHTGRWGTPTDRHTDKQAGRQRDRQAGRHTKQQNALEMTLNMCTLGKLLHVPKCTPDMAPKHLARQVVTEVHFTNTIVYIKSL